MLIPIAVTYTQCHNSTVTDTIQVKIEVFRSCGNMENGVITYLSEEEINYHCAM